MDPFLPGEIPVMVLRYLAANKCEGAALSLIQEMPLLKAYIPPKPAKVSNSEYIKHLARSSVNAGLKELLADYGNSKILVEEMMENSSIPSSFPSDSLVTKLKAVQEVLDSSSHDQTASTSSNPVPRPAMEDRFTSTDAAMYECEQCLAKKAENKTTSDSCCQTEEFTAVQFGLQDDIPRIFYKTLLSDNDLQMKIAQTINEHIEVPEGDKHGDVVQQISSKAETEIDKFLVELLKDLPADADDSNNSMPLPTGIGLQHCEGPTSFSDLGSNLSSMFKETVFGEGPSSNPPFSGLTKAKAGPEKLPKSAREHTNSSGHGDTPSTSPPTNDAANESGSSVKDVKDSTSKTPKRITPTPLPSNAPPAVFNSSVLIEKKRIDFGGTSARCSVKTASIEPPPWQKLNRKSICPKVPDSASGSPKVSLNTRVIKRSNETLLTLGSEPERKEQSQPQSTHKRKTTPQKLTPEKAKSVEFMHVYYEGSTNKSEGLRPSTSTNGNAVDSTVKKTPVMPRSLPHISPGEGSQPDVTPLQQIFSTNDDLAPSTLKTISPNALQRLIASANKIHSTLPAATFFNKKKSFSTPRKRKHVRSLTFQTPPSLKAGTPGFEPKYGFEAKTSHKRKSTEDVFSAEARSKKRLNWPDSEKKKSKARDKEKCDDKKSNNLKEDEDLPSVSFIQSQTAAATDSQMQLVSKPSITDKPVTPTNVIPSMPTILEESMTGITEDAPIPAQSTSNSQTNLITVTPAIATNSTVIDQNEQCMFVYYPVILSDGTTHNQPFKVVVMEGMQTLIPVNSVNVIPNDQTQYQVHIPSEPQTSYASSMTNPVTSVIRVTPHKMQPQSQSNSNSLSNILTLHADSALPTTAPTQPYQIQQHLSPPPTTTVTVGPFLFQEDPPLPLPTQPHPNGEHPTPPPLPLQPYSVQEQPPPLPVHPQQQHIPAPPLPVHQQQQHIPAPPLPVHQQQQHTIPAPPLPVQSSSVQHRPPPPPPLEPEPPVHLPSTSKPLPDRHSPVTSSPTPSTANNSRRNSRTSRKAVIANASPNSPQKHPTRQSKRKRKSKHNDHSIESNDEGNDDKNKTSGKSKDHTIQQQGGSTDKASTSQNPSVSASVSLESMKSQSSLEDSSPEVEVKGRSSRRRTEKPPKKPKVTINVKELFGDTPAKLGSVKTTNKKDVKLPVDVRAAQAVASQAVPLGNVRRSPRKHPANAKTPQASKLPYHGTVSPNENAVPFPTFTSENQITSVPTLPTVAVTAPQETIPFNIVPAPLGFPEPTPIKNFIETGFLNISNCGFNSPLITPLKSDPPMGFNDTHFTLPPTPRVIDDHDSNSNSTHSLKLFYDGGFYPVNLLTSTPMKPGIPRTPGKGSSSSNSRSPPIIEKLGGSKEANQSNVPLPLPKQQQTPQVIVASSAKDIPVPVAPASSVTEDAKSDGEISSDDDEETPPKPTIVAKKSSSQTSLKKKEPSPHPPPATAPPPKTQVLVSSSNLPRNIQPTCPPSTQPNFPVVSVDPCHKKMPDFQFQVGGRGKTLTIAENHAVLTLIEIGSTKVPTVDNTKQVVQKPKSTPVVPTSTPPAKPTNNELKNPYNLLKKTNISDLIKFIHRKTPQGLQAPPKNS